VIACLVAPGAATAKGGKLTACVAKSGPDKGTARFVRGHKCKRGERKVTWNKSGQPGPGGAAGAQGQAGAIGPAGPAGAGGSTDQLLTLIEEQQSTIDTLTERVDGVTQGLDTLDQGLDGITGDIDTLTQGLGSVTDGLDALSPQVAALCDQATDVTAQSDALRTVISGITLTTILAVALNVPAVPSALGNFSCPA
jgi:uncharacterized protein YoxC